MTTETSIARPPKIAKDGRVMSPTSLANLKPPYKPGENGHGRVYPLKERLYHALDKPYAELTAADRAALKVGDVLVLEIIKGAIDLNPAAIHQVWDRVAGPVKEETPPNAPVIVAIEVIVDHSDRS